MNDPHEIETEKYDPKCLHQRYDTGDIDIDIAPIKFNFCPWCGKYLGKNEPKETSNES